MASFAKASLTGGAREDAGGLRTWWPGEAVDAIRLSLAVVAAIWLSMRFEFAAPHWAGWTVLSVTLSSRASSLRKSLWRAFSTLIGVAVALLLVGTFAEQTLAFDVALALWLGVTTAASTIESGQRSYGFALMGFTVPIVALANVTHPADTFATGVDRCSTILLGIACAYAANVFVAPGVPDVGRNLADKLDAAATACATWLAAAARGGDPGAMPSPQVLALSEDVVDSFTEQPSLRSGGHAIFAAPSRLRHVLAAGLLRARLPHRVGARSTTLLGDEADHAPRQLARVWVAARLLRRGDRIGHRRQALRPHLLLWNDHDWDGRAALDNALRTVMAVSAVNAFWFVTGWSSGASAVTWAGLLSMLLASRPNPVSAARAFVVGVPIAVVVGLTARYGVLILSGDFMVLAAVLMPVSMIAVLGRTDPRAIYGTGYGFLVLGVINPTNTMTYDLAASLNGVLAEMLGMGFAVIAFAALPPPANIATIERRARRRLLRSVHRAAADPRYLLPSRERWLLRNFDRLALIVPGATIGTRRDAQTLLLVGLLLLALRKTDDALGRSVGRQVWNSIAPCDVGDAREAGAALRALAGTARSGVSSERIAVLGLLIQDLDLSDWPGLPARAAQAVGSPA